MAAHYSAKLIEVILRGPRRHSDSRTDLAIDTLDVGTHVVEIEVSLARFNGKWIESTMGEFRDDITALVLDTNLVNAAKRV